MRHRHHRAAGHLAPGGAGLGPHGGRGRYKVDHGRPHIRIKDADICRNTCEVQACTFVCPASCYKAEGNRSVTLITDGCLECGSCRVICTEHANVA
jgi:ferredoxin like protein